MSSSGPYEPPAAPRASAGLDRGTNQAGLRLYNERLVLSLVRRQGALPKAEIARQTGLSAQTISVIMRQLEADELLTPGAPLRGRVGQPSVPYSLNPDGAFSFGLKIGRRSSDLVLMDFVGEVVDWRRTTYRYPTTDGTVAFLGGACEAMVSASGRRTAGRTAGIGIAIPFELWNWADQIGAPDGAMDSWRDFDPERALGGVTGLPAYVCNDATAACGAELVFGVGRRLTDFLYFFVGTFVGGGLVLDGSLHPGKRGNAAAVGSILVPAPGAPGGAQLIGSASIYILEQRMAARGLDAASLWRPDSDWSEPGTVLDDWIAEVARGLAYAIVAAVAVTDIETVVIDGAFPAAVRERLVARTAAELEAVDRTGLLPIAVREGSLGDHARALGAASLPLMANFTRDSEVLFKEHAAGPEG